MGYRFGMTAAAKGGINLGVVRFYGEKVNGNL